LLLHFTGKHPLDIPFYFFRSLGKMDDKVQAKPEASSTFVFHHGLIKLLVVEEMNKLNRYWLTFLFLSGYELDVATPSRKTPKSKFSIPRVEQ